MSRHKVHKAQREANAAAMQADQLRTELETQTRLEKQKSEQEKSKAQRILRRSLRAGGGGYFETDQGTMLGGSGVIG